MKGLLGTVGQTDAAQDSALAAIVRSSQDAVIAKTVDGIVTAVVEGLESHKRPPVKVTIGTHTYRSSIASRGGVYLLGVSAENRAAAGLSAGDEVTVTINLDTDAREISMPADFAAALATHPKAKANFESLSFSKKSQHTLAIEGAKSPETRQRRIAKAIETLAG